ncbi:MAG: TIGR03619 family F420-dependent LLM class oxidoreductase [Acidimicrobiales bacterium]
MKVGITTFVTDRTIDPVTLAGAAEARGFYSLYLPEHTHLPAAESTPPALVAGVREEDYRRTMDPFVALAAAAAATKRIRLGTGVCLIAQHDPWTLAKQVATLDHISGGRVVLGIGYGWNRTEAADHGVAFGDRRARAESTLRHMRWTWTEDVAHGAYSWPKPIGRVPVYLGAAPSDATFRTIADLCDGWMPIGGAGIAAALPSLREAAAAAGRSSDELAVVPFGTVPDEAKLAHLDQLGVTEVVLRIPSGTESEVLHALDDYARFIP